MQNCVVCNTKHRVDGNVEVGKPGVGILYTVEGGGAHNRRLYITVGVLLHIVHVGPGAA
jgi:hypothetical protein